MHSENVEIGSLSVEIIRKNNLKNLYIRVKPPNGRVAVSAPTGAMDKEIELFVLKKMPEIVRVRDRMLAQERQSKREYVSGEAYYLWGKPYRLQIRYDGIHRSIMKTPAKIIMTVPEGTNAETREALLTEWYRGELKRALENAVLRCEKKQAFMRRNTGSKT